MININAILPEFIFTRHLAVTYNDGSYGSGDYNSSTTAPAPSTQTTQTNTTNTPSTSSNTQADPTDQTTTTSDQPSTTTDTQPRTTSTQSTTTPTDTGADSATFAGTDPMVIIIAGIVIFAVLVGIVALLIKKTTSRF